MNEVKAKTPGSTFTKAQTKEILSDYKLGWTSRYMSLIGRKEVLSGKAKFGIFGDGKELPQIAMAKVFQNGDFRSGYYRDQTFMLAIGELTIEQFFAQLYAHPDEKADPFSAGRQMNSHFATRLVDEHGEWIDQTKSKNTASGISPTAGQMARLVGLAQASKVYRENKALTKGEWKKFSKGGNEVAFGTIGDASTSEGVFWETINAIGVLQLPFVMSVWDDAFGISVPKKYQTTKESISKVLSGFQRTEDEDGYEIFTVKAWDYVELIETYQQASKLAREEHIPTLVHVEEVTQPQGHSTSGSHERYKSKERLEWEAEYCCLNQFRKWILAKKIASESELEDLESDAMNDVITAKNRAWQAYITPMKKEKEYVMKRVQTLAKETGDERLTALINRIKIIPNVIRKDIIPVAKKAVRYTVGVEHKARTELKSWLKELEPLNNERYNSHLYSETPKSPLKVKHIPPKFGKNAPTADGRIVVRDNFDKLFEKYPQLLTFGEDVGALGDVNKGLEGLQEKYGALRITDTGIREATILGQGIGMALRGLRPIAEIQYLDYLLYCFYVLSDDLSTLRYRTKGGQAAPVIIRTRGHRLEGIWHSGSPMGIILSGARGIHLCVPRNLTEAAGFYNTLLQGDDPAIVVEPLNAYRLKEKVPENLGEFTTPLGVPEVLNSGSDITVVSYGSTLNIIHGLLPQLQEAGISVELIDVRTLMPFDINHSIVDSLKKTNRLLVVDEDVPGGASAYILQKILQDQKGFYYLDSEPRCLSAKDHRPAYASDGDYFSKPNAEEIFDEIYSMMREVNPGRYPEIY
ncbi:MAG TPA: transketolase [Balneolaceae bacterium]|nr:transketolase [Balneolaceae bacterium]|tara:strand:- start:280905 stop:283325 length:2421 start_codon:yes stop_codon:yes gene_type:complete